MQISHACAACARGESGVLGVEDMIVDACVQASPKWRGRKVANASRVMQA
jgi:hypothetical protein